MSRIKIDLISRVEGHGGIEVNIDNNRVRDIKINIYEGPRLIEQLLVGKTYSQCLNIVPRICAICTLSHRYASIKTIEKILNIKVSRKTLLLRELMHMGEIMESHSLHVFVLALPDFLGYSSIIGLPQKYNVLVSTGLAIKKLANHIMKVTSARMIHGENPIVGGFGKYPSNAELEQIKKETIKLLPLAIDAFTFFSKLDVPDVSKSKKDITFMCLNSGDEFGFVGDSVLISPKEERDIEEYKQLTNERAVPYSFAKRSTYKGKSFTVGALARINLLKEQLSGDAKKHLRKIYNKNWRQNPLYNNHAQLIEVIYCLERIPKIVNIIKRLKNPKVEKGKSLTGEATGAVEAPRGTLYHHFALKNGKIASADIITPTDQNLDEMERFLKITAENLLAKKNFELTTKLEMVVRAFDPCISCSAHFIKVTQK